MGLRPKPPPHPRREDEVSGEKRNPGRHIPLGVCWGCFAPVISQAMDQAVRETPISITEHHGQSLEWLVETYVNQGIPVILWATIEMEPPRNSTQFLIEGTGETFTWIYPLHCLLLIGSDSGGYYFNDPLQKKGMVYSRSSVKRSYRGLGCQAVVAIPRGSGGLLKRIQKAPAASGAFL